MPKKLLAKPVQDLTGCSKCGKSWAYLAIARRLAAVAAASSLPRTALREALRGSVLMDHAGQAARLGAALRSMWQTKVAG